MDLFKVIIGVFIIVSPLNLMSQHTPYGLKLQNVQNEVKNNLKEFDRVVLSDISSYTDDDRTIQGIGQKEGRCFSIKIKFKDDTTSFYDLNVKRIKTRKLKEDECPEINYDYLSKLSNDSLNLKTRGTVYSESSHQNEWTLLIIYEGKLILKQAYDPESYQKTAPVEERSYFMETISLLEQRKKN